MKRKILAAALAAVLAFGCTGVVYGGETNGDFGEIELKQYLITDENVSISPKNVENTPGIDLAAADGYSYRACLSSFRQSIYDGIAGEIDPDAITTDSSEIPVIKTSATVGGSFESMYINDDGKYALSDTSELTDIAWAILRDCPEYYWLKTYSIAAGFSYSPTSDKTQVVIEFYPVGDLSEIESYIEFMDGIESQVISDCGELSSVYKKVLYIHDLICDTADYDSDTASEYTSSGTISNALAFSPLGVFYDGKAVCQGYSLAFKLLLNDIGIDCLYQSGVASGVNHAWNWALMDDGLWYGVDTTWDGQKSATYNTYFLLGTDNFNSRHSYTNSFGVELSADDYVYGGDGEEVSEREKKMTLLINNMTADGDPTDGSGWNKESTSSFKWSYINGCMISALLQYGDAVSDDSFEEFADGYMSPFIGTNGSIAGGFRASNYALDDINSGKALIELIDRGSENSSKYGKAVSDALYTSLLKYMLENKTTAEGNLWHKNVYPYQVWLDGIYMETPFYLEYELKISKDADAFEKAAKDVALQIGNVYDKLRDEQTGLYYHGYDAQADPDSGSYNPSSAMSWATNTTGNNKGASSNFWLRGMGWYAMALVDDIELLKKGQDDFGLDLSSEIYELVTVYQELMDSVLNYRDDSGLWYQVVDKGREDYNYTETSGSAALSYALMKGANLGVVPESYYDEGYKAFESLLDNKLLYTDATESNVTLNDICGVAGLAGPSSGQTSSTATRGVAYRYRDGSYEYYTSERTVTDDAKGAAPLIMAYSQVLLRESGQYEDYSPVLEPVLLGDVTGDGYINSADATMVLLYYAGRIELDDRAAAAADVTGDGVINSADATRILLYYAGRITSFDAN